MGFLVWHLSLLFSESVSMGGGGASLPVDLCVDVVHWLSLSGKSRVYTCILYKSEVNYYLYRGICTYMYGILHWSPRPIQGARVFPVV